jgi:hypothetical protein
MKIYGQILKAAIVLYLVVSLAPGPAASVLPSLIYVLVHEHRLLLGALLFTAFLSFYIIDSLLEYRELHRRELRERHTKPATGAISAPAGGYQRTSLPNLEVKERQLLSTGMKSLVKFGISFVVAIASLVAAVAYNSDVIRVVAILTFAIGAAAARVFWVAGVESAARHFNLSKSWEYRHDLESYIGARRPFGLYLHDFGSSIGTKWSPSRPYIGTQTANSRPTEKTIVERLSVLMPVFAFHSDLYPYLAPTRRISAADDEWFSDFLRFSAAATLLVVDAETLSAGIEREIASIISRGLGRMTMIVATTVELGVFREKYPHFVDHARWIVTLENRADFEAPQFRLPDNVLAELKQTLTGRSSTQDSECLS